MEEPAGGLSRRSMFGVAATPAAATVGLPACGESGIEQPAAPTTRRFSDTAAIAKDAYIFGFPLVLMDVTRVAAGASTPANRFRHARALPTPARRDVVRLDQDTLYSAAWLDPQAVHENG